MTRIIKTIEIEDQPAVALFDTGAVYTYVRGALVRDAPNRAMVPPARVGLGGRRLRFANIASCKEKTRGWNF